VAKEKTSGKEEKNDDKSSPSKLPATMSSDHGEPNEMPKYGEKTKYPHDDRGQISTRKPKTQDGSAEIPMHVVAKP